jgi:hypothetical protein
MKRNSSIAASVSGAARQREVRKEIENFVNALSSYPDCFARNPYLSFEQHLFRIVSADQPLQAASGRRRV